MPLTLEVSYFNSYYVKRLADVPYIPLLGADRVATTTGLVAAGSLAVFGASGVGSPTIDMVISGAGVTANTKVVSYDSANDRGTFDKDITFTATSYTFTYDWTGPQISDPDQDWYIEESRIRGGYNNVSTDYGVKAYIVEENDAQARRGSSLIYSGIFNSRTGINQTNQFSVAEEITRSVDPISGTIQKLFAEDTNLLIFQERKVNNALIDKDAIYTAEGSAITTSGKLVIGQITPISGEWGISTNPESFADYGYAKYFVDRSRNCVLRLAGGQITEISNYGMIDFFRDQLSSVTSTGVILGAFDVYNKCYMLSIQPFNRYEPYGTSYKTLAFDERSKGWTSFFTYKPDAMFSSQGYFYTAKNVNNNSDIYRHNTNQTRNSFYGLTIQPSSVQFVFNPSPTNIKTFQTINYEGSNGWEVTAFLSEETGLNSSGGNWINNVDTIVQGIGANQYRKIYSYTEGAYTENGIQYYAGFNRKQNKYMAVVPNNTQTPMPGEVVFGNQTTGIKAYYATVTMRTDATTDPNGLKELFAVSSTFASR
jgi:hypothetical protein|tara:strand:+ start:200 stop:1816 length:1617 start_codon:yes stop_codon:yes gene_type:complete